MGCTRRYSTFITVDWVPCEPSQAPESVTHSTHLTPDLSARPIRFQSPEFWFKTLVLAHHTSSSVLSSPLSDPATTLQPANQGRLFVYSCLSLSANNSKVNKCIMWSLYNQYLHTVQIQKPKRLNSERKACYRTLKTVVQMQNQSQWEIHSASASRLCVGSSLRSFSTS